MIGRRAKPAKERLKVGDRVVAYIDKEKFTGEVLRLKADDKVRIKLDEGGKALVRGRFIEKEKPRECATKHCTNIPQRQNNFCDVCLGLAPEKASDQIAPKPDEEDRDPDKHYGIEWKKDGVSFTVKIEQPDLILPIHYYGYWRKTRTQRTDKVFYAIDIFATREGQSYTLDSLIYTRNPIKDRRKLSKRIIKAVVQWERTNFNSEAPRFDIIRRNAEKPTIFLDHLQSVDKVITQLRDARDTSCRAGGQRLVQIHSDQEGGPIVDVFINLTMQAIGGQGRVPSLGGIVMTSRGRKGEGRYAKLEVDSKNVDDLIAKLKEAKKAGDVKQCRQIRALLRKLGHKGGARSATKEKKGKKHHGKEKVTKRRKHRD